MTLTFDNLITDEEETWGERNVFLQKDYEITMR